MGDMIVNADVKEAQLQAVVIRKDGSKEDLGTIAYWHKNPLMRALHKINHRNQ